MALEADSNRGYAPFWLDSFKIKFGFDGSCKLTNLSFDNTAPDTTVVLMPVVPTQAQGEHAQTTTRTSNSAVTQRHRKLSRHDAAVDY